MSKRGQNEGSIYRRFDGRWTSVINLGYRGGKLKRQYFYGKTREEAAGKLSEAIGKRRQGLPVIFERQTVSQFLNHWIEDCVKPSVRPNTYYSYEQSVRLYLNPNLGPIQLRELSPQHVQSFMNAQLAGGWSPRLVQYQRTVLRCALNQALKWDLISRNVASLVDPPRYSKPEPTPFDPTEVNKFLEAIKGDRLETLFHVALSLGLRQGEVLGLRWQDIDFQSGILHVRVSLQRIDKELRLVEVKTERSKRSLPVPNALISSLRANRRKQLEQKMLAGEEWQEHDLVFATSRGTPLVARNVIRSYHRLLAKGKLKRRRFHDLRHSCATFLFAKNIPARIVMQILGHSNINLTMNTYTHVMPEMLRDATKAMNSVLRKSKISNS